MVWQRIFKSRNQKTCILGPAYLLISCVPRCPQLQSQEFWLYWNFSWVCSKPEASQEVVPGKLLKGHEKDRQMRAPIPAPIRVAPLSSFSDIRILHKISLERNSASEKQKQTTTKSLCLLSGVFSTFL